MKKLKRKGFTFCTIPLTVEYGAQIDKNFVYTLRKYNKEILTIFLWTGSGITNVKKLLLKILKPVIAYRRFFLAQETYLNLSESTIFP